MPERSKNVKLSSAWNISAKSPFRCSPFAALMATLLSFAGASAEAQKPSGQEADAITIVGAVRNTEKHLLGNATVRLVGREAANSKEVRSRADGTFTLPIPSPGTYTLWAEKDGRRSNAVGPLVLSPGDKKQIELVIDFSSAEIEFDDKPNFTVAGVTDWNNTGTHASDTSQRTSEALAKEARSLKLAGATDSNAGIKAENTREGETELREERDRVKKVLASAETADAHRKLAELDERLGEPLDAVHEYERATQMDPSEQNYFEWGTELLLHRADQPAAEVLTKGVRLHPLSARMREGLGVAFYASGNAEDAARKLCEAADLNPADPAAYIFLGRIEKSAPTVLPCSEEKLARFVHDQPGNALANYYYGIVLWKRSRGTAPAGSTKQAEALLEKATKLDPKFGEAYLQLGIMRFAQGRSEQAVREYQNALEASPQLSDPHYRLGLAYRRMNEEAKAEQEFHVYEEMKKAETAALEKERRELRQFLIILKDQPPATPR